MSSNATESSLSFPKLGEDNYSSWSKNMKAYLMKKKVWLIVSGIDVKPFGNVEEYAGNASTTLSALLSTQYSVFTGVQILGPLHI